MSATAVGGPTPYQGNDKLLFGIIMGVIAFWLFAQTTLNVAPDMQKDLGLDASMMNIAVAITALFSGIFIVVIGGLVSAALVWSYLNALGADQHVEHARATALAMLVVASAAITAGLSRLHQATPRWIAAATLASLVVMVQVPPISRLLNLSPLHAADWAIVAASGVLVALARDNGNM